MIRVLLSAVLLMLAACQSAPTTTGTTPPPDALQQLVNFTVADLQAASADAHAQPAQPGCQSGDCTAYQCYDWLAVNLPAIPQVPQGATVGAVLIFQKTRDVVDGAGTQSGFIASLNRACAPLFMDVNVTLVRLGLIGAGAAGSGGAATPILNLIP